MNSNAITFDYQSGQIRRDLTREAGQKEMEIFVPNQQAKAENEIKLIDQLIKIRNRFAIPKIQPASF